ncbi:MAG: bifunctional indole-3-glycerol-phosphate synthase TrpC/phosphoribosylanthranilate isomerase TrpF [Hyphomonadaceae bacterium]
MLEPGGVLSKIVAATRADLARRYGGASIDEVSRGASASNLSLTQVLKQKGARFIFELKRASPSGGALRQNADAAAIAAAYRSSADAISVLTERRYFGGSVSDLAAVRANFDGPILAKDFVIDPRQVAEARRYGADAILVMLSVLEDAEAAAIMRAARSLNMEALVEVHDAREMQRARRLGAGLIGINNRDLKTLRVDLALTPALAPLAPAGAVLVCESGIGSRNDVERLSPYVDAFLVGSALMRRDCPGEGARELAYGRVKICGLTDEHDAALACEAGASFAGVVFAPGSSREISLDQAAPILARVRQAKARSVGVFRDQPLAHVIDAARTLQLDVVQLHGHEDQNYIASVRRAVEEASEVWTVSAVGDVAAPARGGDRSVFDAQAGRRCGGAGKRFDWALLQGRSDLETGVLAGGIGPDTARAAQRVGAYAIDLCSGVEAAPRRKDPAKLKALFGALRPPSRIEAAPIC